MKEESIQEVYKRAAEEKWSYPELFNALRDAGVERYEVNVLTYQITYVGGGTSLPHPTPAGFKTLAVGPSFDLAGIKKAIERSQKKEITYPEFLAEIAAAGVPYYRVDMKPRTVTYHGSNRKDKLVEKVP